jgi:hypothetical protein
LLYPRAISGP